MHDLIACLLIVEMIDWLNWIFIGLAAFVAMAITASMVMIFHRHDLHADRRSVRDDFDNKLEISAEMARQILGLSEIRDDRGHGTYTGGDHV
jgi:hypothetical protein